jgi:hypothetical protein
MAPHSPETDGGIETKLTMTKATTKGAMTASQ